MPDPDPLIILFVGQQNIFLPFQRMEITSRNVIGMRDDDLLGQPQRIKMVVSDYSFNNRKIT